MQVMGGMNVFPPPVKAGVREGHAWKRSDVEAYMANGGGLAALIGDPVYDKQMAANPSAGVGLMTMEQKLQDATKETQVAFERFDKARSKFRAEIKNEVASVEAAAKKIASEFERVVLALSKIQRTYTSAEFVDAIANAERLAAALTAIQALSNSKVTFAVIDKNDP